MATATNYESLGLVGRYFHIFGGPTARRVVKFQGTVRGDLGHGFFLVQLEGMSGEPDTLAVEHLSQMTTWQFYLDNAQMREWNSGRGTHYSRELSDIS